MWSVFVASLWLRLSEEMFGAFIRRASQLIADPNVERVGVMWEPEGARPVIEIAFHGLDQGEEIFQSVSDVIVAFFEELQR